MIQYVRDHYDSRSVSSQQRVGFCNESYTQSPIRVHGLLRKAQIGVLGILAVTASTAMPDPILLPERRRNEIVVTTSVYRRTLGRVVSRAEVLKRCRQILDRAEQERLSISQLEAKMLVDWESDSV